MQYDVVIVGAGPAGLSAAIRLRQLAIEAGMELSVCVLEKGSEVGAHILSGAVFEPRALNELIPDWQDKGAPLETPATEDQFLLLTKRFKLKLPLPPQMHNKSNYVISLGKLTRWLAQQAESLGVEIFAGFPAADVHAVDGRVCGIVTGEFGRGKDDKPKANFQPGMVVHAKYTLMAEGARGSLSELLIKHFKLRQKSPQTYGLGVKEIWEVDAARHKPGTVIHSVGWPLDNYTYGGGFLYHLENNQVAVGFITGLDYRNPFLDPFKEMQRFKTHPALRDLFTGARRIAYGARALNEGGLQSLPKLTFPGGALIGCAAGFLNVAKIKGSHTAMKSGMVAAESVFEQLQAGGTGELDSYEEKLKQSWVYEELRQVRNIRPGFHFGLLGGLLHAALDTYIFRGRAPWTFRNHADHKQLRPVREFHRIDYPKPDGVLTFDKLSSVFLSGTNHEEDQPVHLTLKDDKVPVELNLPLYDAPEQRYCPANVYEIVEENNTPRLQINAQNCVHCKTCDIKDPTQNIVWVTPEGGGGPNYGNM